MIKIVIGNIDTKIVGHLPENVHQELYDVLAYKVLGAKYIPKVKNGHWDGVLRFYNRYRGQSFYTGMLSLVRDILNKNDIPFKKIDKRIRPAINMPDLKFTPPPNYEQRDYQDYTIDRSLKFTRGVAEVCTGGGKTLMMARLIGEIKTFPFIFYVLTKDLMYQAHEVLSSCLNTKIGMIGDGKADFQKINVATIQTTIKALNSNNSKFDISNYKLDEEDKWNEKDIQNAEKAEKISKLIYLTKGLYLDECHHASSRTIKDVLTTSSNAYWRYGGSATPYRDDNADILIQAMFGAKIVKINASFLIKKGYLIQPHIFFEPIETFVHYGSYSRIYKEAVAQNDKLNNHIAETANHLNNRNLSLLILVKQYNHGNYLQKRINNSVFVTGKTPSKKRIQYLSDLRTKKINCMIATTLADEGLDIPTLDVALLAGGGSSSTRIHQRIGRTLRKDRSSSNPRDKSVVVIYDHKNIKYLDKHIQKTRRMLKKEKEFIINDSKGPDYIMDEIDKTFGFDHTSSTVFDV